MERPILITSEHYKRRPPYHFYRMAGPTCLEIFIDVRTVCRIRAHAHVTHLPAQLALAAVTTTRVHLPRPRGTTIIITIIIIIIVDAAIIVIVVMRDRNLYHSYSVRGVQIMRDPKTVRSYPHGVSSRPHTLRVPSRRRRLSLSIFYNALNGR